MLRNGTRAVPEIPAGGGGGFPNTYSLEFDGVDDYVGLGNPTDLQITGAFSFSCWINTTSTNYEGIYFKGNSVSLSDIYIRRQNNGTVRFFINNVSKNVTSSTTVNDGNWHHIMCVYVPSTSMTIYIDGSQDAQNTTTIPASINNNYGNITIGSGGGQFFNGKIDEASIFNTDQSANIATLSTSPVVDITSLSPIAWYRNGDNGAYKSTQWLIPNNENKDKVSNYSFDFDGVDDRIQLSSDFDAPNEFTISFWIKPGAVGVSAKMFVLGTFPVNANLVRLQTLSDIWLKVQFVNCVFTESGGNDLVLDTWQHISFIRDSSNVITCYRNGLTFGSTVTNSGNLNLNSFGRIINNAYGYQGGLNEIAFWKSDKSSDLSAIYNSGVPTDLTSLSPFGWWRIGQEATFSGGVWTVPDSVGTNTGTSNAMTIEDRVGTSPNSENNALSYNMDLGDRVEDVPS